MKIALFSFIAFVAMLPEAAMADRIYSYPAEIDRGTTIYSIPNGKGLCKAATRVRVNITQWKQDWSFYPGFCGGKGGYVQDSKLLNGGPCREAKSNHPVDPEDCWF